MSDAQPCSVAAGEASPDVYTLSFGFIEQGVPVPNYQRRPWWGSYRLRVCHRESE